MKIAELKTFVVGNPPPAFGGRYFLFLKLKTACGIEGVGEVYAASFAPKAIVAMIEDVFERHVEGADPFRIEALWRNVYGRGYSGRPDVSLMGILSAIEMALWDIVGKAVMKPVYALIGGKVHERLRSYTYLYPDEPGSHAHSDSPVYSNPDAAATRALKYMAQGFTAVKFDSAGPYSTFDPRQPSLERLELCEAFLKTLRQAVGTKCDLLFGTHGQFTVLRRACALRGGSRLTSLYGSRSRRRPRRRRKWPRWRPNAACRSRPASGLRQNMNSPACSKPAPHQSCK